MRRIDPMSDAIDPKREQISDNFVLPRSNGELIFASPWEARAFGMAVALNDEGVYAWRELSASLAAAERVGLESTYYERWLQTLENLALAHGLITESELEAKITDLAHDDHHH